MLGMRMQLLGLCEHLVLMQCQVIIIIIMIQLKSKEV